MNSEHAAIFGNIATWVGALGTIGAFTVAFFQIRIERKERKRRELNEQRRLEREQASKISAWIENGKLFLSNSSDHPVYDATITLSDGTTHQKHLIAPGIKQTEISTAKDTKVTHIEFKDHASNTKWQHHPGKGLHKK